MKSIIYLQLKDRHTGEKIPPKTKYLVYLNGYFQASLKLLKEVVRKSRCKTMPPQDEATALIYPAMMTLAHTLELTMKFVLKANSGFNESVHTSTHDLRQLFNDMRGANHSFFNSNDFDELSVFEESLDNLINVFEKYKSADPVGWRYPDVKRGEAPSLSIRNSRTINVSEVLTLASKAAIYFRQLEGLFLYCPPCEDNKE